MTPKKASAIATLSRNPGGAAYVPGECRRERRRRPEAEILFRFRNAVFGQNFEAADPWPLSGARKIVPVSPRGVPIRAYNHARLKIINDDRFNPRYFTLVTSPLNTTPSTTHDAKTDQQP